LPTPQSLAWSQATGAPASSFGGTHWSSLQTVPDGHWVLDVHFGTQP
jgi:hypothetical protein